MKKSIAIIAFLLTAVTTSAQFYVSLSAGATLPTNKKVIGQKSYFGQNYSSDFEGSFGEGFNGQLRVGYFFNETIGLELAGGYLYGSDQTNNQIVALDSSDSSTVNFNNVVDMYARARAFGASLSAIVNVTKNVYVRLGALTKVGGKTETFTEITDLTLPLYDVSSGTPVLVGANEYSAELQTNFQGKLPFGFIGAAGYKYEITDNISVFAEIEYMNINVTRNSSGVDSFTGAINGVDTNAADFAAALSSHAGALGSSELVSLSTLAEEDVDWSELDISAPYSSIGANIGVTYKF